jgi:hypothetical protein
MLGAALYWLGCIVAIAFLTVAVLTWFMEKPGRPRNSSTGGAISVALIAWCIGVACRYMLA